MLGELIQLLTILAKGNNETFLNFETWLFNEIVFTNDSCSLIWTTVSWKESL